MTQKKSSEGKLHFDAVIVGIQLQNANAVSRKACAKRANASIGSYLNAAHSEKSCSKLSIRVNDYNLLTFYFFALLDH